MKVRGYSTTTIKTPSSTKSGQKVRIEDSANPVDSAKTRGVLGVGFARKVRSTPEDTAKKALCFLCSYDLCLPGFTICGVTMGDELSWDLKRPIKLRIELASAFFTSFLRAINLVHRNTSSIPF